MEIGDSIGLLIENLWKPKVLGGRRVEHGDCLAFLLETFENQWLWEVEDWKTMADCIVCLLQHL